MQTNHCKVHSLPQTSSLLYSHTLGQYPPFLITSSLGTLLGTTPMLQNLRLPLFSCFFPQKPQQRLLPMLSSHFFCLLTNPGGPMWCGMPPVSRMCEYKKLLPLWQSFPCYHGLPCMIKTNSEYPF